MHTPTTLVRTLIENQFSHWHNLPLILIKHDGTDNDVYKLGQDKIIRLPRTKESAINIEKEIKWLPQLPTMSIKIPTIIGQGNPTKEFHFPWLIYELLEGETPSTTHIIDLEKAAFSLGNFVKAMQHITINNGPYCKRGKSLKLLNQQTTDSINLLKSDYDTNLLTKIWNDSLALPEWTKDPIWIHGDIHPGNILVKDKEISGVIDFSLMGAGDPAADLMAAWTILDHNTRAIFYNIIKPDMNTWYRGRAWALTLGVVGYPYYHNSNKGFAAIAKNTIDSVIDDFLRTE